MSVMKLCGDETVTADDCKGCYHWDNCNGKERVPLWKAMLFFVAISLIVLYIINKLL